MPAKQTPAPASTARQLPPAHALLPDLEILIVTYNHGKYIEECLNSMLAQQTTYTYRIHILDDHSTDDTSAIAARYAKQHPTKIIHHLNPRNIGGPANVFHGYAQMHGQYWCIIEGDDYWSNPSKIQTQLNFLNAHPHFVGSAHNTIRTSDGASVAQATREVYTHKDFALGIVQFHTSSLIWRNVYGGAMPFMHNEIVGDIYPQVLHTLFGDVHYLDKPMSTYRLENQGIFQQKHPNYHYLHTNKALLNYIGFFTGNTRTYLRERLSRFRIAWLLGTLRSHPLSALRKMPAILLSEFLLSTQGYKTLYNRITGGQQR